jgi:hypothetical protein
MAHGIAPGTLGGVNASPDNLAAVDEPPPYVRLLEPADLAATEAVSARTFDDADRRTRRVSDPSRHPVPPTNQRTRSGRDLSRTAIWAGIVAASETNPAQIDQLAQVSAISHHRQRHPVATGSG